MPEFIDPITCDYIEKPALAPHGIVLGYVCVSVCMIEGRICCDNNVEGMVVGKSLCVIVCVCVIRVCLHIVVCV